MITNQNRYTYIVRCEDGSFYTGYAKDIVRRLRSHYFHEAKCAKYTRSHQVEELMALWVTDSAMVAMRLESRIKNLSRPEKEELIQHPELANDMLKKLNSTVECVSKENADKIFAIVTSPFVIREAKRNMIPQLQETVFVEAKQKMRESGNLHQWTGDYPSVQQLQKDIIYGNGYIVENQDKIPVAYFFMTERGEPTYKEIYDGQWLDDSSTYAVIHRLASIKSVHGIASLIFEWASIHYDNIRIDTHRDNSPMQHIVEKNGFQYCGIIHLENGDERLAYQRIEKRLV